MSPLQIFFEQNQPIIEFAYGLTFFVMGLAIALQSRSSSRLELARSLAWLAAFGITHSLFVWGELFAYVHEPFLDEQGHETLHTVHLALLSLSFACLFTFGVALLRPLQRSQWLHARWLRWIAIALSAFYTLLILIILPQVSVDPFDWHNNADALARYAIGFPGGILAAYGLREQTYRHIAPLNAPGVVAMLRTTGLGLALFAILGGLIPPPVSFFPGSLINTLSFERAFGVPILLVLSLLGLVLVVSVIRALEVFQVETERRIETMEQQQILAAERERIGRDLHDGTVQTAYTAGLLIDSARKLAEPDSQIATRLDRAVLVLNEVIADLRRNLGELRAAPSGESLAAALQHITTDPRFRSLVEITLDWQMPNEVVFAPRETQHLLAIVYEALSNVVRHANARQVKISVRPLDGRYRLTLEDDGDGIPRQPKEGYGLRNMQERARLLGGELSIHPRSGGKGTIVRFEAPCEVPVN